MYWQGKDVVQKDEFEQLFRQSLEVATTHAEYKLGHPIARHYEILLYGAGHSGDLLSIEAALDALYLSDCQFFAIIDVSVVMICEYRTTVFVRASGHMPVPFQQTWNPDDKGPFKQLIYPRIKLNTSTR